MIIDLTCPLVNYKLLDDMLLILAIVMETSMECDFETQKEQYVLRRIKARAKLTEIWYIFFGIHTANEAQLADRIGRRAHMSAD